MPECKPHCQYSGIVFRRKIRSHALREKFCDRKSETGCAAPCLHRVKPVKQTPDRHRIELCGAIAEGDDAVSRKLHAQVAVTVFRGIVKQISEYPAQILQALPE